VSQDPHPTEQAPGKPLYASEGASTPDPGIQGGSDGEFGPQAGAESLAAVLRDVLDTFDAIRADEGTGEILRYQSTHVTPEEYQRWQAALQPRPAAPALTTGLVVQPYRTDRGDPAWVFRCWGTDACDGWLSLDHPNRQSAERARDRHVAEAHAEPAPAHNDGPTVREAAANDRRWWETEKAGEQ
jgi:hypothetical protein